MKSFLVWIVIALASLASPALAVEPVLLDFYAQWCGPCKAMAPTVASLEREGYAVQRIDVDANRELAAKYAITSIPTFVIVRDGREIDRISGAVNLDRLKSAMQCGEKQGECYGSRMAIVRIYCQDSERSQSIGSGTVIRWNGRFVVVTARHVIAGARKIVVALVTRQFLDARVLKADPTWDCAVLELSGIPEGIQPAEVAFGQDAMPASGARMQSCGYGPDNTFVVNSGRFVGYKGSAQVPNGPNDWMEISGVARPGDSGGPVFNERGKLAGVLWGTGTTSRFVICVQAGRLHMVLNQAVPPNQYQQRSYTVNNYDTWHAPVETAQRYPSPPMPEQAPSPSAPAQCGPGGCPAVQPAADYLLPYRAEQAAKESAMAAQLQQVNENLRAIQAQIAAKAAVPPPVVAAPVEPPKPVEKQDNTKTFVGKIADKQADFVAEHGGPLTSRLAKAGSENLDDESPAVRFKGFTQAKLAWLIYLGFIAFIFAVGVWVLHRIGNRVIPKLQAAAEKTPNTVDDRLVAVLSGIHERVNAVEDKLPKFNALKATADTALHVATNAAAAVAGAVIKP